MCDTQWCYENLICEYKESYYKSVITSQTLSFSCLCCYKPLSSSIEKIFHTMFNDIRMHLRMIYHEICIHIIKYISAFVKVWRLVCFSFVGDKGRVSFVGFILLVLELFFHVVNTDPIVDSSWTATLCFFGKKKRIYNIWSFKYCGMTTDPNQGPT